MSDMKEFQPDLFTLEDENGNEEVFELVDVYKEEDITYYALIPQQSNEDEDEDYFVILKQDDNEADGMLVSIEDEDELDRLAEIFIGRILAATDDEDCDCDCDCEDDDCECNDEDCDCCH